MTIAVAHDFQLPITSESTLREFVELAWGVRIPDVQVCPSHTTPWRAFADAYFARYPVCVWHASRGFGGKSFTLATLSDTEAVTLGADVNVLGGSGEQSKRVLEHMQNLWHYESAPRGMLVSDAATTTRLSNGAKVQALMASQASVRGPHPVRLRLDEIDEMALPILDAAMGQPMSKGALRAQTVMSSTRQYADGTMQEILQRAMQKGWGVYSWCWREVLEPHGWLKQSDVDQKRNEVTDVMWATEYDNQEPSPSSRAIQPDAVEKMFDRSLGEYEGAPHEYIEIEPPVSGATYVHGADWARKSDWTIIDTFRTDVTPAKCVAFERTGRLDWPVMISKLDARIARYGGKSHDDGTGLGDVIKSYKTQPSVSVIMIGAPRAKMLSDYVVMCEKGSIIYPFIRWAYQEHKFASVEAVFGSGEHLPDTISAGALAGMGMSKLGGWVRNVG